MSSKIKITKEQLLYFSLNKQGLLKRFDNYSEKDIIEKIGPLHDTSQKTPYLSLLARFLNFDWKKYAEGCSGKESFLMRFRCMRGTLHIVPKSKAFFIESFQSDEEDAKKELIRRESKMSLEKILILKDNLIEILKSKGPKTTVQLKKDLVSPKKKIEKHKEHVGLALKIAFHMNDIQYGNSGVHLENWFKEDIRYSFQSKQNEYEGEDSDLDLIRYYFEIYGPSSLEDFIWWTGFTVKRCRDAFKKLLSQTEQKLVSVVVDGIKEDLFVFENQVPLLSVPRVSEDLKMVRFLPYEDALIKGYKATRHRFFGFDEDHMLKTNVMRKGEAYPSLWINGKIVGGWKWIENLKSKNPNDQIVIDIPPPQDPELLSEIQKEVHLLSNFIGISNLISWQQEQNEKKKKNV